MTFTQEDAESIINIMISRPQLLSKMSDWQVLEDLIGEVGKDLWGLAYEIVTKKLLTRRTPA